MGDPCIIYCKDFSVQTIKFPNTSLLVILAYPILHFGGMMVDIKHTDFTEKIVVPSIWGSTPDKCYFQTENQNSTITISLKICRRLCQVTKRASLCVKNGSKSDSSPTLTRTRIRNGVFSTFSLRSRFLTAVDIDTDHASRING